MSQFSENIVSAFSLEYDFFDDMRCTELRMILNGTNILGFTNNIHRSTRWNLDELVEWLRDFVDNMHDDPYPVNVEGDFAALKDENARVFDPDDQDAFDAYYDKINGWVWRHTWHHASSGAILAHLYFQLIGNQVEISWNNRNVDEGVQFDTEFGCGYVPKEIFIDVMNRFLRDYADHWFH